MQRRAGTYAWTRISDRIHLGNTRFPVATRDRGCTVLIVEDDPDIGMALSDLLEHHGYTTSVSTTRNFEARPLLPGGVILADVPLCLAEGRAFLAHVVLLYPDHPLVLLTSDESDLAIVASLNITTFAHLRRPYDKDRLRATVQAACSFALRRRSPGPNGHSLTPPAHPA